jgi:hypothetical protein
VYNCNPAFSVFDPFFLVYWAFFIAELLGRAKRKRRGKKKLMIDEIKELTQVQIRHQVMIDSFHNKQKMDIAPSTKYLMRSTGSGIKRIRKKSRAGAEDVLRHPSLPLPKKLRNVSLKIYIFYSIMMRCMLNFHVFATVKQRHNNEDGRMKIVQ